ncbi:MAG: hypothetical protein UU14_C0045G0008 [Candidatus Roizmanbacteria bacterium GW2011_GWB1_40_7]|uniref:DUF6922 domain-containing protein n=1 Tax=Candidatus Roizmanbacteria bacterium GW2011_GWB1_40_7 TaxID=1618482 RepID=A0A0G0VFB5_9BACT|nr:MAG: hypothetical protein US43_C0021G0024 [Candidatus Levybacteria bacterium GW2011_GWA1_37_16]KKR70745.1 MAG: hypothetical protein UU14_C0045G0008 [Candidatus Roizmanbacteria bacterium GW2011_GWB1_40_7]OGH50522.1 MAG: hypothetical protein A3H17_04305 [Candidatus Levybacteria bacterium RIFCSPLOWO2_12_FULL_37_14]
MNQKRKMQLPESLRSYFWDVKFEDLDLKKSRTFILKRVLDRGNTKALSWLRQNYTNQEIEKLLLTSRDISPKTANFWSLFLGIDKRKVVCLQKPYSPIQFGLSS